MPVTPELLRQVMGKFATGVTIVTTKTNDGIHGLTVNAFTSVSLEPPLVLICIQNEGFSHEQVAGTDSFVVNILSGEQEDLANRFANPALSSQERFEKLDYELTPKGIPLLSGVLGHLECHTVNRYPGGDHTIFLGQVENTEVAERRKPLLFYDREFYRL